MSNSSFCVFFQFWCITCRIRYFFAIFWCIKCRIRVFAPYLMQILWIWTHCCRCVAFLYFARNEKYAFNTPNLPYPFTAYSFIDVHHHIDEYICYDLNRYNPTRAVARVRHALSFCAMPSRLDMKILYCAGMVPPCSGRDLGAVRFSFVCVWQGFGDFRSKLEVLTHVSYAGFYVFNRYL
jgi:hypothetical protein